MVPARSESPAGKTICFMWERKWAGELDNIITGETCNREALAEVMIFAATKTYASHLDNNDKQQRTACETVLCTLLHGVNRGEANSEEADGLDDLAKEVNSAVANIADRIFG
ncbi:hypothetical protein AAVH_05054 [Aphelenchoides avenae]|nr:hypothetical protein AAVH_05054 [Aphelenchus avenae]